MNKKIITVLGICLLPVVVFFFFFILADGFGFHTLPIIISQSMIPTTLGLAMACIMPAGLMDFSPGARLLLGAIAGALLGNVWGLPGIILGAFVGSMIGGIMIAALYYWLKVPSMVVSLGVLLVVEALTDQLAAIFNNGSTVKISSDLASFGTYPKNIIITFIACLIFYYVFYKTKMGILVNATGNDETMLKRIGVNVDSVKIKAFILSGVFCFLCAIMQICYSGIVQTVTGTGTMGMVFKPMMGVLIAMQLIKIYDNVPLMIFVGEVVIQTVFNGFIAMGWTDDIQNIILGVFLLIVMGVSVNTGRFAESARKRRIRKNNIGLQG